MKMLFRSLWLLALSMSAACAADNGWLQPAQSSHAHIQVRSDAPTDGNVRVLLDITLDKGWKTYWRTPGDGGFRPVIDWSSQARTTWHWPQPVRFDAAGFSSVGYHDRVTFPLDITTTEKARLRGTLTLSLCSNLCVVNTFPLDINLADGPSPGFDADWKAAMATVPPATGDIAITDVSAHGSTLSLTATSPDGWPQPALFADNPDGVSLSVPQLETSGDTLTARFTVLDDRGEPADASRLQAVSMVLGNGVTSQQITVKPDGEPLFWQAVAVALLGGLILNLMPCVLPVLGMKLASLMTLAQADRRQTRLRFLATTAGIIFSFLALAAVMSALRLSGAWTGWGFQFQHAGFIATMAVVTWLFCFSLAGVVEIRLPAAMTTRLATAGGQGMGGSFLEGAFATLLATPCTAPFLGTAVAFALAAPLPQLWLIFLALGIGMSLPWLLVSLMPGVACWLPRPGPWMGKLRLVLVIMMLGSSLWLMSLLVKEWGARYVLLAGGLMVALFLWRCAVTLPRHRENLRTLAFGVVFGAGLYAFLAPAPHGRSEGPLDWQPFSQAALDDALAGHKRVLVDITADWCLNCKVNAVMVLHRPDVVNALQQSDVVLLQGNWSKPSAEIERFLSRHGASGIPFNAVFGPTTPDGEVLSSLLNKTELLTTLDNAGAATSQAINKDNQ
ncbi:protein-disulfide reductase DsbD family protein [Cronobacter turicensis]